VSPQGAAAWDRAYGAVPLDWDVEPHPELAAAVEAVGPVGPMGRAGPAGPGRVAVEWACGDGRPAVWLARQGWDVTAVDFSRVAVDRGRRLADHHGVAVRWEVADVVGWEPPGAIDLAVVMYLHIPPDDLATVLGRAAGALAPEGTLFVLGWDAANAENGTGGPRPAELLLSVDGLRGAAAGLDVVRAERVPQLGSDRALDALLVARRPAR
jgi:SAM-dependent methyltransferase